MVNINDKNVFICLFLRKGRGRRELKEQADKLVADHSFYQIEDKKYF